MKNKKIFLLLLSAFLILFPYRANADSSKTSVDIPVRVEFDGDSNEEFEFTIEAQEENAPLPKENTIKTKAKQNGYFKNIAFDKVGTYSYYVKQIKGNKKDIVYDESTYQVTVYVENEVDDKNTPTGNLVVNLITYKNNKNEKSSEILFKNTSKKVVEKNKEKNKESNNNVKTGVESIYSLIILLSLASFGLLMVKGIKEKKEI